jgi:glycosyltransferase involved in cell wall biosynthesis
MPKPLTIGVDVRDLRVAKTGTKTYLEDLCIAFKKMNTGELRFHFIDTRLPVYTGNKKAFKLLEHLKYQLWKQLTLPFKAFFKRCDIIFCTDNFVPLIHLGYKTIPVFHDAFFFETPENYGRLWLWVYKKTAIPAAMRASYIVTPTEYAKKQISHFVNVPPDKLIVIHEGPKNLGQNGTIGHTDQFLKSLSITNNNYILHVGAMYKRKNIPFLIDAFSEIKKSHLLQAKRITIIN